MELTKSQQGIQSARRKNRATRKLLRIDGLDSHIRLTAITIIDFLSATSGYEVAWPSVGRLAKRLGISERTMKRYLAGVRKLGIFDIHQLSPEDATLFLSEYGLDVRFPRCRKHAPNIYQVNDHPIWGNHEKLCPKMSQVMVEVASGVPVIA